MPPVPELKSQVYVYLSVDIHRNQSVSVLNSEALNDKLSGDEPGVNWTSLMSSTLTNDLCSLVHRGWAEEDEWL